jgi:hypothetical protein
MSISYRRYEILLPRRFNDGQPVPNRLITEVIGPANVFVTFVTFC